MKLTHTNDETQEHLLYIVSNKQELSLHKAFTNDDRSYLTQKLTDDNQLVTIHQYGKTKSVYCGVPKSALDYEKARRSGASYIQSLPKEGALAVVCNENNALGKAILEGIVLASYRFDKYLSNTKNKNDRKLIYVKDLEVGDIDEMNHLLSSVFVARTLVNEPPNYLTATQLAKEMQQLGKTYGFTTTVFDKSTIEQHKMGGLLAVNKGSIEPPTFSIMEWKPKGARNTKPIVLVGKGLVYDTGGLSLKPTANSMDYMKSDMGGSATVIGTMCAVAGNKLPLHIIALVPSTDNRPGQNAYANGDVITMYDKQTVEVLNTDAEGRMILADALAYAKQYKPELVINFATLTGMAPATFGKIASAVLCNEAAEKSAEILEEYGCKTGERLASLPMWDEYGELLKSDIADMKNVGGRYAGTITAGKFLEKYTDYPFIHVDIAGTAFFHAAKDYQTVGGTGVGVRLMYHYLKDYPF